MDSQDSKEKIFAARFSVYSNLFLVIAKITVGIFTSSISIISEAIHSGIDLLASFIAIYSVKTSVKPADKEHPFGHGKVENVSGLLEGILIIVAACFIVSEAIRKFINGVHLHILATGLAVMFVSALANFFISGYLFKVAKKYSSAALEADAWHLRTDTYTSASIFAALGMIILIPWKAIELLDPVFAIITAFFIIRAGMEISKKAIFVLTDKSVSPEEEAIIRKAIEENAGKYVEFHSLRTRHSGADHYINLHLVVSKSMHVDKAHELVHHLAEDIKQKLGNTDVMIHLEPPK